MAVHCSTFKLTVEEVTEPEHLHKQAGIEGHNGCCCVTHYAPNSRTWLVGHVF